MGSMLNARTYALLPLCQPRHINTPETHLRRLTMSDQPERISSGDSDPETKQTISGEPDHRFKEHGGGEHGNQGARQTGFEEDGDGTSQMRTKNNEDLNAELNK